MTGECFTEVSSLSEVASRRIRSAGGVHVVVGPVVWEQLPDGRRWYFTVACGIEFAVDKIVAEDKPLAQQARRALFGTLAQHRPIVVHDMDDELEMAHWCSAIWPCAMTSGIVAAIEKERSRGSAG
jgi:hypothetical protein